MSRYVENIVANHRAAAARRAAGKPIWDARIPLTPLLDEASEDLSVPAVVMVGHQIAQLLRERIPAAHLDPVGTFYDPDIDDLIQKFEEVTADSLQNDMAHTGDSAADCLDEWIEELYDWADQHRVWLGR